ncbi:hypothetical protein TL16_g04322 [Triparma laevis f. inornata]|uniref:Uncharacterized protein n=2 Tax=Triparma laevis TaxID=1534972 RepID=A0A9W7F495_9STRA|nr:hypothetical protein TL16_g04322 [Triparma laevis f. inornata]GMI02649.1 hypothetical protein TrLO_g11486 [Triparma laevis f. longispina]
MDDRVPDIRYCAIVSNQKAKTLGNAVPINKAEFMECSSMSTAKKEYYGERVIEAITGFLEYKGLGGKLDPKGSRRRHAGLPLSPTAPLNSMP